MQKISIFKNNRRMVDRAARVIQNMRRGIGYVYRKRIKC